MKAQTYSIQRQSRVRQPGKGTYVWCLVLIGLLATGVGLALPVEAQRGLSLENTSITDPQGNQVVLYKESHALVIGISNYTGGWPALPGVQRDIQEVEEALKAHGFQVVVRTDLNKIEIDAAFNEFINQYGQEPENRLLFYFAGHGHTVQMSYGEELGYIVPVDASNPNYDLPGFQSNAMDMQRVEYYAKRIQSKHAIFLFDACFSGSLFALSRAVPEIINYKTALPVRQFVTSGSADETVPDESIFRAQFVRALNGEADGDRDGYVTGTELSEFLQVTVVNYSYNAQHPQYGKIRNPNLDKGDFVFKLPETPGVEAIAEPAAPPEIPDSFDDIEAQLKWQEYVAQMEDTASKVRQYETLDVSLDAKVGAWERFLQTFARDNPYSSRDEELRNEALTRIEALKAGVPPVLPSRAPVAATPIPAVTAVNTYMEPVTGMTFVWVAGGCFDMGSPEGEQGRNSGEGPVHEVCLDDFWLGQYEVTQEQWQQVMGNNPASFTPKKVGEETARYPVENVSWKDIQQFLRKLNQKSDGATFRLPSEAEWEYAGRAGTQTAYSFGSDALMLGEYAWYGENSDRKAHPVGQLKPNAWGLYDMHGNVWEWVDDPRHDNYKGAPSDGRAWEAGGDTSLRMLRGGSWGSHPWGLRSANRIRNKPDYKSNSIGFRVVRSR